MNKKILDFFEYIYDRQNLAFRKQQDKRPWTRDSVLHEYKFCNVRRFDDRGTKHFVEHMKGVQDLDTLIFNSVMYRIFNVSNFYSEILKTRYIPCYGKPFPWKKIVKEMDRAKEKGVRLFSTAYMICGIPEKDCPRPKDKHVNILLRLSKMTEDPEFYRLKRSLSVRDLMRNLRFKSQYLIGDFLAYQIVLDLSYFSIAKEITVGVEKLDYCGPGTIYSLKNLFPKLSPEEGLRILYEKQDEYFSGLRIYRKKDWRKLCFPESEIRMTDIENCLCEYRKYFKLKTGIKTRIRRYRES